MARLLVVIALVASSVILHCSGICTPQVTCSDSETLVECPSKCRSDYCPRSECDSRSTTCTTPKTCPKPACKCRFNYRRAANGTCIPTTECPAFPCYGQNEIYNPCPPFCPSDNCSQATPTGICPLPGRIGIVQECNPTCRCKPGFWRRKGICVPYGECPGVCPKNEVYSYCMNRMHRLVNCSQIERHHGPARTPEEPCIQGCVCKEPYLRGDNGTCVLKQHCDASKPPVCGKNEVYSTCMPDCPPQICDSLVSIYFCPLQPPPNCSAGCICQTGYLRTNDTAPCIPKCNCPQGKNSTQCSN